MKRLTLVAALTLAGCNTVAPEPITKVVTVQVPVTVPCKATVPSVPVVPDETAAPDVFVAIQRLKAGKVILTADNAGLRGLLSACTTGAPK